MNRFNLLFLQNMLESTLVNKLWQLQLKNQYSNQQNKMVILCLCGKNIQKNQKSDLGALKPKEKKDDSAGAQQKFNPFARRKVKPKILWEVGQKDEESKENEGEAPKDNSKSKENAEKEQDITPSLVQEHQEKAAALSQAHQFAIDEEVLAQSSFTSGMVLEFICLFQLIFNPIF